MTPAQSVETLLPCPFCGGPVKIEKTINKGADGRDWWGVVCRNTIGLGGTCAIQQRPSASVEAATTRWNTRPQSIPEPLLDEGLVLAIELIERTPIGDLGSNRKPTRSWEQKRDDANMALATLRALSIPRLEAGRVTEERRDELLREWQTEKSEWFGPDIREILDDYAEWLIARLSSASAPDGEDR